MASSGNQRALQEAALDLFERRGFENVTIDDIAEAAGTSRRTFFRYFATKEDSALADHADRIELFERLIRTARPAGRSASDHVTDAARTVLSATLAEADFYRKRYRLILATPALRDRMHLSDRAFVDLVAEVLGDDFNDPQLGSLHARMLAAAGMDLINAILERWVLDPQINADHLFTLGVAELQRAAAAWTTSRPAATHVVIVARTELSPAEIRERLT